MLSDTICAISTAPGVGGIAVARISGNDAVDIAARIWQGRDLRTVASHTAHLGYVLDDHGDSLDQAVATVFRAPASFTGQNVVELSVHGSAYVQQALIQALVAAGARLAEPGEFTRRAFSAGRMDLAQAEAVADLIASESKAAHRLAINQMRGMFSQRLRALRDQLLQLASLLELELDFSEEDVQFASRQQLLALAEQVRDETGRLASSFHAGHAIKHGIPVAIIGPTNAGKSSLLNALLDDDRAIVSDMHGTTRDIVEDTLHIGDYLFRLMDTAGLRDTSDQIESIGIERSRRAASQAAIIIYVVDGSNPAPIDIPPTEASIIIAVNKADLTQSDKPVSTVPDSATAVNISARTGYGIDNATAVDISARTGYGIDNATAVDISARTGYGIDRLRDAMQRLAAASQGGAASVMVTNQRHYQALKQANESIARAIEAIRADLSGDLIAQDIRLTIAHLSAILGDISSSEILANIFSRFCIGK